MFSGACRKIISTYVYKQGVNFPQLTVVVNAGGGGSDIVARQIPGRESRNIGEVKPQAYLVDFVHEWDTVTDKNGRPRPGPILKDDKSREKSYSDLGFTQVWVDTLDELPFLKDKNGPN
jgi:superfamily II DNA or RNA helicase